MKTKTELPDALHDQMRKAGKARAAQMTTEDRQKYGRQAWKTRLEKATAKAKAKGKP